MHEPHGEEPHGLRILLVSLFAVITVAAGVDLAMDRPATVWSVHVLAEVTVVVVSLSAAAYLAWGWVAALRDVRELRAVAEERREERDAWRERAGQALSGLGEAMDAQFTAWELTPAERETALMILKGLSHKRIGKLTDRSERTVRQHAVSVYRKSGLAGRSELSAFFLEGLLLPGGAEPDAPPS
ncbi:MAG: hypothetical protein AMXMBFR53_09900 [Gemmatimonadota bacterium]